jgi:hypothetical protein
MIDPRPSNFPPQSRKVSAGGGIYEQAGPRTARSPHAERPACSNFDPRPSTHATQPTASAAGGGNHDDWRSTAQPKSNVLAVASRQALTPPVQGGDEIYRALGEWGHTRAGRSI